jgi:hypothetical protein
MLEFLGYALFAVPMIGCLVYIMSALEVEETSKPRHPNSEC